MMAEGSTTGGTHPAWVLGGGGEGVDLRLESWAVRGQQM